MILDLGAACSSRQLSPALRDKEGAAGGGGQQLGPQEGQLGTTSNKEYYAAVKTTDPKTWKVRGG